MQSSIATEIVEKITDDVFAVYTNFTHEGKSNAGDYTFVLGFEVDSEAPVPDEYTKVEIEPSNYLRYSVPDNKPENVFSTWMSIWEKTDLNNRYVSDFERYAPSGEISVYVGTGN